MSRRGVTAVLIMIAAAWAGCRKGPPVEPTEIMAIYREVLPADPGDRAWNEAPLHPAPLILQDMVEPRLIEPSTTEVRVQAVSDGSRVAFRLEWTDTTQDDKPGMGRFVDACAVQFPLRAAADVPAPQMGEEGRPVEITYWSSAWQAVVDGRQDNIRELFPGATVDHYPFEAPPLKEGSPERAAMAEMYSPARALGGQRGGPRKTPVEDLVAAGPGTLEPAESSVSAGTGRKTGTGWSVVLSRPLPEGVRRGQRTQVALAVWQGTSREAGARKMRSVWIPVLIEGAP
ncbi:MAG: hypothetical protein FJW35_15895 [Acidobacteria bacterium]|nr:hypothetical protein [Acidobacteriota bacterium]